MSRPAHPGHCEERSDEAIHPDLTSGQSGMLSATYENPSGANQW